MGILTTHDLSMSFGGIRALDSVNLDIVDGEIRGLIGPNGSGKTTLLNLISGFYRPTAGRITWLGEEIQGRPTHTLAALGITRTFQNIELFGSLSVLDHMLIGSECQWTANAASHLLGLRAARNEERTITERAHELLSVVNLDGWLQHPANSLPFGLQRMLELARALAVGPRLLLLDEPSAGLNPREVESLGQVIRDLRQRFDMTIVLVAHTMRLVMGLCDTITVLDHGVILAEGNATDVANDPRVVEAYLGTDRKRVDS